MLSNNPCAYLHFVSVCCCPLPSWKIGLWLCFLLPLWEILNRSPSLDMVSITKYIAKTRLGTQGLFCPTVHGYSPSEPGKSWQQEHEAAVTHIWNQEQEWTDTSAVLGLSLFVQCGNGADHSFSTLLAKPRNSQTSLEGCLLGDSRSYQNCWQTALF